MATIRDFGGRRQDGTVESAKSGSVYQIQTDGNGVISCSCIGWIHDSAMRKSEKRGIKDRWCSHLTGLRDGTLTLTQRPGVQIVETVVIREVAGTDKAARAYAELEEAEKAVKAARGNPEKTAKALERFREVRERCMHVNDHLALQAEDITRKLSTLTGEMEELL